MRRFGSTTIGFGAALGLILALGPGARSARSAGFYYGGAYYRETPERPVRRPAVSHSTQAPPTASPSMDAPLPVPRPRFPEDERTPPHPSPDPHPIPETRASAATTRDSKPQEPDRRPPPTPVAPSAARDTLPSKPSDTSKAGGSGATTSAAPLTVPVPVGAGAPATAPSPPLPPPKPADVVAPTVAPSGATTAFAPRSPDDDPACPGRLAARHVVAETTAIGPQPDERCTVVQAVRLTSLTLPDGATVEFPDHPVLACTTADVFSLYVRDLLSPLAKGSYGTPVSTVWTGPGLECRSRDHIFGAKLSAHGQGLAIDIAQVKLSDGRTIAVGDPKTDSDTAFETAARAGACGYFHTVLGPGSDAYHRTHWHFDLEVRGSKGDSKYCK